MINNSTVLITGAARGIGFAVAKAFAEKNNRLYLIDLNKDLLHDAAERLKRITSEEVLAFPIDISDSIALENVFSHIKNEPADIVVNCAGISTSNLIKNIPEAEWDKVFAVNTKAVFLISKMAAKQMIDRKIKNGRIINISSQASKIGERGNGAYCASKAAVNMITQVMGLELAEYGITVNAICPGYVRSELLEQVFRERGPIEGMTAEEYEKVLTDKVPVKRLAVPEDVAELVMFLACEKASYMTGISTTLAGGTTLI